VRSLDPIVVGRIGSVERYMDLDHFVLADLYAMNQITVE
jgi:hypothetical protein